MKDKLLITGMIALAIFAFSVPIAMLVGKYQVCKNYFPDINRYACLFTNLPPISR